MVIFYSYVSLPEGIPIGGFFGCQNGRPGLLGSVSNETGDVGIVVSVPNLK